MREQVILKCSPRLSASSVVYLACKGFESSHLRKEEPTLYGAFGILLSAVIRNDRAAFAIIVRQLRSSAGKISRNRISTASWRRTHAAISEAASARIAAATSPIATALGLRTLAI